MWDLGKLGFLKKKKHRNQSQTEWGASQIKKGRKSRDSKPVANWHLVPNPPRSFPYCSILI